MTGLLCAPEGDLAPPRMELCGVGVDYETATGTVTALTEVSCAFAARESVAIVGRSGAGKSTLVSVLALMRTPSRGMVCLDGVEVPRRGRELARLRARHVGMIFQSFHLDPQVTALNNALLPWHFAPWLSRRDARRRAMDLFDRLGIADLSDRPVHAMSGGQRQRVAIARALVTDPDVVIADEPTGNLDEHTGNAVAEDLYALTASGTTVIVVTHDHTIAAMADRTVDLAFGRICSADPTSRGEP
ncbi:Lipoprotein-releasing system ATP-binding protein LolD [Austwickia sp. TVS 96-490-7B]|uniref:ABC transporter ATP-binding protein n=1 Tax=Austwickia sp. TVS 96-490-7B TaxID=2830843 RepID=UPI001C59995E|nr:ABC transporter ATP-binding protein [Austwickia sp. TVS 96-490-7B]MBW3086814.1 Lipoprotein-releasing system ATP-binding protein LolD [Austwickia sp. TVS 96-490-7B]